MILQQVCLVQLKDSDIGMASRELKESELESLTATVITDGLAVIVNKENPIDNITSEEVRHFYR